MPMLSRTTTFPIRLLKPISIERCAVFRSPVVDRTRRSTDPTVGLSVSAADHPMPPPSVDSYDSRWESAWSGGLKIGEQWDAGRSSGALVALLRDASSPLSKHLRGGTVMVPGCGRGYDVAAFVEAGAEKVVGLELAPSAVQAARSYLNDVLPAESAAKGNVVQGDFFDWKVEDDAFDIG